MNPYAKFLENRNAREVIGETGARLAAVVAGNSSAVIERSPAPGKWSPRQILCHLADCEVVFTYRIRQALAEPNHVIQPFDQDAWARHYSSELTAGAALKLFRAARNWNLALLGTVRSEDFSKPLTHPERGRMTFQTLIETMAGHDLNHLAQLEKVSQR